MAAIQLVAGLGNPGTKYEQTRHNAGFWFVDAVARDCGAQFRSESKSRSEVARCNIAGNDCRLQKPQDFMNRSGRPVAALATFYRIPRSGILVVLNGQIISAKRDAAEFMPVLDEIRSEAGVALDLTHERIVRLYIFDVEMFEGRPVDPRADLYAAGIVLFELLTGTHPLASTSAGTDAASWATRARRRCSR